MMLNNEIIDPKFNLIELRNDTFLNIFSMIIFVFSLCFLFFLYTQIKKQKLKKNLEDIRRLIADGASTYLKTQYKYLFSVVALMFVVFLFYSWKLAFAFLSGSILSVLAGFLGMKIATFSNARTTAAAEKGLYPALKISFSAGMIIGLTVVVFGTFGVFYVGMFFGNDVLFGFAFGASFVALFSRVGGGIYTKAADVGADFVGKVEKSLEEDDPRNPASIADNVGDNVGDIAGMGADLFESFVSALVSTIALGAMVDKYHAILPLVIVLTGILASILGYFFVRSKNNVQSALRKGMLVANILNVVFVMFYLWMVGMGFKYVFIMIIGLFTGFLVGYITEYYTSDIYKYVKSIAESSKSGVALNILEGIAVGLRSTKNIIILISMSILISFMIDGIYGIALAGIAMLSTLGISLAIDAFGPVVDNAGGIAVMAKLDKNVRKVTDELDSVGNTTAAIGKGFAIASAIMATIALFNSFAIASKITQIRLDDPLFIIGVFIGGMIPFFVASLTIKSVQKSALIMVEEIRRQFQSNPNILKNKALPDYNKCIEISTHSAIREMFKPSLVAISTPILVGVVLGTKALAGLLLGALVTGSLTAITLSNSGGAWDNAKKYLEKYSPKEKEAKAIAVIGDTVGDPFKDTSGPALNILIKLMTIVSLVSLNLINFLHANFFSFIG